MPYAENSVESRLLANDPEAVGQVIRWVAAVLTGPRFWTLRDEWADLHQEVMARVVESLLKNRYDPARDFRTYVQGVARFTALQTLEEQRRRLPSATEEDLRSLASDDCESRVVSLQLVRRALDLLPEECRLLIRSYFFECRGYAEIAAAMDVPVGTVKSRLFRCLESAYRVIRGGRARSARERPRTGARPTAPPDVGA